MSRFAATQIPKPADEQVFERQCIVLWRGLLGDPTVQRVGRRGQRQNGVDLVGRRGRIHDQLVGIQCKLKGPNSQLTDDEIRAEVKLALTFQPPLREYFIVTTAPDSAPLQALARRLTDEQHAAGREIEIHIWGWGTLEENIADDPEARKAFDPSFTPFADQLSGQVAQVLAFQTSNAASTESQLTQIASTLGELVARATSPLAVADDTHRLALEKALDDQVDDLRQILTDGDPVVAQAGLDVSSQ